MTRNTTSRRSALRTITAAGAGMAAGSLAGCQTAGAQLRKKKADCLALIGDWAHSPDYIRMALRKTLVREAGLSIDFVVEEYLVNEENLEGYKMLLIFRNGSNRINGYYGWYPGLDPKDLEIETDPPLADDMNIGGEDVWITAEQGRAIRKFVENGGALWAWHNNSHTSIHNEDYKEVEGAIYTGHPPIRPFWVRITNHDHPITKGVNDFLITDEQHYVEYYKDPADVLAISSYEGDGQEYTDNTGRTSHTCQSVWAYDYGKGRVCFMAPGHMISALWNPEMVKLQHNAVPWLLRKT